MTEHATSSQCRNCGADTTGNYCHMCGQETRLHAPSLGEFLHEFIGHYVALEGRLWGTITRLLFRPGLLTNEYLAGRRKRYVEPLRLYLSLSIIFFALLKFSGMEMVQLDPRPAPPEVQQKADAIIAQHKARTPPPIMNEDLDDALARGAPSVSKAWGRFDALSMEEKSRTLQAAFFGWGPYAIFLAMPLFALYLKVLYLGTGKRYGEHLLFALHANSFAFIMFASFMVVPDGFLKFLMVCWVTLYLPWAMRRVYQKSKWGTFLRWMLLMLFHALTLGVAMFGIMAAGVMSVH